MNSGVQQFDPRLKFEIGEARPIKTKLIRSGRKISETAINATQKKRFDDERDVNLSYLG